MTSRETVEWIAGYQACDDAYPARPKVRFHAGELLAQV